MTYLDSSVLLRHLLRQPSPLDLDALGSVVTGRITRVEVFRVLERLHLTGALETEELVARRAAAYGLFRGIPVLELDRSILDRAEAPMPVPLKSLDALHLATVQQFRDARGKSPLFATHDAALARAAQVLGFEVVGA